MRLRGHERGLAESCRSRHQRELPCAAAVKGGEEARTLNERRAEARQVQLGMQQDLNHTLIICDTST